MDQTDRTLSPPPPVDPTLATGVAALAWRGRLAMVGAGGGSIPFDFFKVPPGAQLVTSLNGGSIALQEVVGMAALGRLKILVDRYPSAPRSRRTTISSTDVSSVAGCSCPERRADRGSNRRRHASRQNPAKEVSAKAALRIEANGKSENAAMATDTQTPTATTPRPASDHRGGNPAVPGAVRGRAGGREEGPGKRAQGAGDRRSPRRRHRRWKAPAGSASAWARSRS